MAFRTTRQAGFQHCDAAGIVFYPRYFEFFNSVVEEWWSRELGYSFAEMHLRDRLGIPLVHVETSFHRPSALGDSLEFSLRVLHVGTTSLGLHFDVRGPAESSPRVEAVQRLVHMHLDTRRKHPFAPGLREALKAHLDGKPTSGGGAGA